ncbi:MAG: TIR domain-containing protein [Rhodospirillales bacterium]|nr:TIR domain-containing protein [Rhodospirillales bacterium]
MTGIFISYRCEDTVPWTGRIYERLVQDFPRDHTFMDVGNIAPGLDFVMERERSVGQCDTLIAVIGRGWVDARNDGTRAVEWSLEFGSLTAQHTPEGHGGSGNTTVERFGPPSR